MNLFKHRSFAFGCIFFFAVLFLSRYTTTLERIIVGSFAIFIAIVLASLFFITKKELFKRIFFDIGATLILIIVAVILSILEFWYQPQSTSGHRKLFRDNYTLRKVCRKFLRRR